MLYSNDAMPTAVAPKPKQRKFSLESLKAGDRLLKAIKDELRKKGEKIDYNKLRRDGYRRCDDCAVEGALGLIRFSEVA